MLDKIHIYITILAAAIMTTVGIVTDMTLAAAAVRLIIIILIFYFLGIIVRSILKKWVFLEDEGVKSDDADTATVTVTDVNEGDGI